ncbi:MAG: pyridoxine 5'-phosphate synthase [Calditrichota bacterium]
MKRLSVLLDDIAFIRSTLNNVNFDPVRFAILSENSGANGIVYTFTGNENGIRERDLRLSKEILKSFFNLRIPLKESAVKLALSLIPDMVTFVDIHTNEPRRTFAVDPVERLLEIQQILPDLQANSISVSLLIKPELDTLKAISKLAIDYVDIDTSEYTQAHDINEEIVALDKIKSAALAVSKWGMGVNCSGNISYQDLAGLAQTPNLEDITLGSHYINRALQVGIDRAVAEALELIHYPEPD